MGNGTAKIHKLSPNDNIDELPLRPICHCSLPFIEKLCQIDVPLSKSEYTIKNTNYFAEKIKKEHISNDYLLVSLLQSHSFQMLH